MKNPFPLAVVFMLIIFSGMSWAQAPASQVPISLSEAINRAVQAHPEISIAEKDRKKSLAALKKARSSRFPEVDFVVENRYTRTIEKFEPVKIHLTFENGIDQVFSPTKDVPEYQSEISVQARELLFTGGRITSQINAARAGIRTTEQEKITARRKVILATIRAYWELKRAQEIFLVDSEKVEHAEDILKSAESRYAQGAITGLEKEKAAVDFINHQGDLVQSQTARKIAEDSLWLEMGLLKVEKPGGSLYAQDEPSFYPVTYTHEELEQGIRTALSLRPEMQSITASIEAKEAEVGVARAGYYPQVDLFGRYSWIGYGREDAGEAFEDLARNYWMVGVNLTLNLFEGFATESRIEEGKAVLAGSLLEQEKMRQSIIHQVREAYNSLIGAGERVTIFQKNVALAGVNLDTAKKRFALGAATIHEVAEYNVSMAETRKKYINALMDYELARAELKWARGEALP
ncbi:MAG: TolC family protein [bacterium]